MNPTTTTTTAATAAAPARASFQVVDDHGRAWPPGFVSETCNPYSRHCVMSHAEQARERAALRRQDADAARARAGSVA